jgi:hypothetical protein
MVNVAGANAKLSMVTASPAAAAGAPVVDAVPAGALGIDGIPLMPGIPGVALAPEPKVTDGCALGREDEHPASNSTPTANKATKCFRNLAIPMPSNRSVGYTA